MRVSDGHRDILSIWAASQGVKDVKKLSYAQEKAAAAELGLPAEAVSAMRDGQTTYEVLDTAKANALLARSGNDRYTYTAKLSLEGFNTMVATLSGLGKAVSPSESKLIAAGFRTLGVADQSAALSSVFKDGSSVAFTAMALARDPGATLSFEAFTSRLTREREPQQVHTGQFSGFTVARSGTGKDLGTIPTMSFTAGPQVIALDRDAYAAAYSALSPEDKKRPPATEFAADHQPRTTGRLAELALRTRQG